MSKKRAIKICNLLAKTIAKMKPDRQIQHKNEVFELPRANKRHLENIRDKLIKKYNLTVEHLKT